MLYKSYLRSLFLKKLFLFSAIFVFLLLIFQTFQYIYLFFSLPLGLSLSFFLLLFIYAFHLSVALAIFPSLAEVIFHLSENRIFYIFYNFGISNKKILKAFYKPLLIVSLLGFISGFFINYQKISYVSKYLKYKFAERILLTVPEKSFANFDKFSVYFENKKGDEFFHFLIKTDKDLATAKIAQLYPDQGILILKKTSSLFRNTQHFSLPSECKIMRVRLTILALVSPTGIYAHQGTRFAGYNAIFELQKIEPFLQDLQVFHKFH